MSNDETYATWNVRLWLDNEERLYRTFRHACKDIKGTYATKSERVYHLAKFIRETYENAIDKIEGQTRWMGAFKDILMHAGIDWENVAELFAGEEFDE